MPGPSSATDTRTMPPSALADSVMREPSGVYLMALFSRLMSTCTMSRASISAMSRSSGSSTAMWCRSAARSRWASAS